MCDRYFKDHHRPKASGYNKDVWQEIWPVPEAVFRERKAGGTVRTKGGRMTRGKELAHDKN